MTLAVVAYAFLSQSDRPVELVLPSRVAKPTAPKRVGSEGQPAPRPIEPTTHEGRERRLSPADGSTRKKSLGRARYNPNTEWRKKRHRKLVQREGAGEPYELKTNLTPYAEHGYPANDVPQRPYVLVTSRPPGMNVYLDGVPAGSTPLLRRLTQKMPQMRIKISGAGFTTVERVFRPDGEGHIRVGVDMVPVPGK